MDTETTFDLLSCSARRTIIAVLYETHSIERHQLTETLSALETAGHDVSEDDRRRTQISLHHNHLPRLADGNLITYDDETVTATAELKTLAQAVPLPDVTAHVPTRA